MNKYSNRYKATKPAHKMGFEPDDAYDWDDIPGLAQDRWDLPYAKYCHVRHDAKTWKRKSKSKHQYHVVHIDLFEPFERDECGVVMTDGQVDEMHYLLTHYELSAVAELVYA